MPSLVPLSLVALLCSPPATAGHLPSAAAPADAAPPALQDRPAAAPEGGTDPAHAAWERLLAAEGSRDAAPIQAFHLRAEVRTREGVQRNDLRIEYRYLAPHYIRFELPNDKGTSKRETGRGPGEGQRAYWLRDGDEVHDLQGREATEDRRLVDRMVVVARNFVAFSNLADLDVRRLSLASGPPAGLPEVWHLKPWWRKLTWLHLESPDFALLQPERRGEPKGAHDYAVELGLDPKSGLPRLAVVSEIPSSTGGPSASPLLFQLDRYRQADGFLVPNEILVHELVDAPGAPHFGEQPWQRIDLLQVELRPQLEPEDFLPRG